MRGALFMFPSPHIGSSALLSIKVEHTELHKDTSSITRSLVLQNLNYLTHVRGRQG